jgi:hypothetical protein
MWQQFDMDDFLVCVVYEMFGLILMLLQPENTAKRTDHTYTISRFLVCTRKSCYTRAVVFFALMEFIHSVVPAIFGSEWKWYLLKTFAALSRRGRQLCFDRQFGASHAPISIYTYNIHTPVEDFEE